MLQRAARVCGGFADAALAPAARQLRRPQAYRCLVDPTCSLRRCGAQLIAGTRTAKARGDQQLLLLLVQAWRASQPWLGSCSGMCFQQQMRANATVRTRSRLCVSSRVLLMDENRAESVSLPSCGCACRGDRLLWHGRCLQASHPRAAVGQGFVLRSMRASSTGFDDAVPLILTFRYTFLGTPRAPAHAV